MAAVTVMDPRDDTGFILKVKPNIENVKYFKLNIDNNKPMKLNDIQTKCGWINSCLFNTITYDIVIDGINIFKGKEFMTNIIGNGISEDKYGKIKLGRYKFDLYDIQQPNFPNESMSADTSIKNSKYFIDIIEARLSLHDKDYRNKDIVMVLPFYLPMATTEDIIIYNLFVSSIKNKIVIPFNKLLNKKKFDVLIPFVKDVPKIDISENMIYSVNEIWAESMIITEIDHYSGSNSQCRTNFNKDKNHNNCELDDILCLLLSKKSNAVVTNDRDLLSSSTGYNFSSKKRHKTDFINKWGNSVPCLLIDNEAVVNKVSKSGGSGSKSRSGGYVSKNGSESGVNGGGGGGGRNGSGVNGIESGVNGGGGRNGSGSESGGNGSKNGGGNGIKNGGGRGGSKKSKNNNNTKKSGKKKSGKKKSSTKKSGKKK